MSEHEEVAEGVDVAAEGLNRQMRLESGSVNDTSPVVCFLYHLMRDKLTPGQVEELLDSMSPDGTEYQFTNGWLAQYAQNIAVRLGAIPSSSDVGVREARDD